uniref:F-box/kelch-repeat protein At3g06240 family n=1 Tax=Cajanus cajan TaxID=3821 RepID=A0A151RKW3_CAJCA|nr:F-box/kelch-repeat protein At3g06240 family [Cajanus cajan]
MCRDCFYLNVWNPSTGLHKRINNVPMSMLDAHLFGIGYDSSSDDYVVVIITLSRGSERLCTEVHCFTLKTNSWNCIESTVLYDYVGCPLEQGSFLNGALHWVVNKSYDDVWVIIAFDVMEKRLSEIPLPRDLARSKSIYHVKIMGECLCLYSVRSEPWIMKEYKVHSSWTKLFILRSNYYPHSGFFNQHVDIVRFGRSPHGIYSGSNYYPHSGFFNQHVDIVFSTSMWILSALDAVLTVLLLAMARMPPQNASTQGRYPHPYIWHVSFSFLTDVGLHTGWKTFET